MDEELNRWNQYKKQINKVNLNVFFKEREVWWTQLGVNIGTEQNGIGHRFVRPVLVLKKVNKDTFIGLPLTSRNKNVDSHFKLENVAFLNESSFVMCEQIRVFSKKRLLRKLGRLTSKIFYLIQKKSADLLQDLPRSRIKR